LWRRVSESLLPANSREARPGHLLTLDCQAMHAGLRALPIADSLARMAEAYRKDAERIAKAMSVVVNQGARLQALFVVALPGVIGALLLYGVYDSVQMHHYDKAVIFFPIALLFFVPLALIAVAEFNQRKFARWLAANIDAIVDGRAELRGARVSAETELVTFDFAFSVIVASFKIPSQMFVVGHHRIWPWRLTYTLLSFVFGWWGIPWGPIYTIQALHTNLKSLNRRRIIDMIDLPAWEGTGGSVGPAPPGN